MNTATLLNNLNNDNTTLLQRPLQIIEISVARPAPMENLGFPESLIPALFGQRNGEFLGCGPT